MLHTLHLWQSYMKVKSANNGGWSLILKEWYLTNEGKALDCLLYTAASVQTENDFCCPYSIKIKDSVVVYLP